MSRIHEPSEAEFQNQVIELALLNGFRYYHTHDSRRSNPGFPDLVLVRVTPPRVIFAEIKASHGSLTPAQKDWLNDLRGAGAEAHVWFPDDLDHIQRILSGRAA